MMQHGTSPAEFAGSQLQRLLLLHLNLAQLCTGKELGESASLEELGEQILYYHQDPATAGATENDHQEAIQLAGLCTALYNLPSTLNTYRRSRNNIAKSSNAEDDDAVRADDLTQVVQLDQSTLIFVPLEDWCTKSGNDNKYYPMLLCVVQVSRSSTYGKGGNSLAIRRSIERWHQLFCLLRGGGIHTRLSSNSNAATKKMTQAKCAYPGMDQWFKGLKTKRQLRETICHLPEPDLDLELEHDSLQSDLDAFRETLPILSLREDLKFHYDAYIGDYAQISSLNGGEGRCLVDTIPPPTALHDGSHASSWTPENPPPHVSYYLGQAISGLLSKTSSSKNGESVPRPELLAVSTFYRGQPLYHHSGDGEFEESNKSTLLLMWYFASYSYKVNQQQQNQQTFAAATTSRSMSHGLVSFSDHVSATTDADLPETTGTQNNETIPGRLLGRPPLAMLSASEQKTAQVMGPHGEWVWAPLVSYGWCCNGEATTKQEAWLAHGILYEWNDFCFLLFVSPANQTKMLNTSKTGVQSFNSKTNDKNMAELLDVITTTLVDSLNVVIPQASPLDVRTVSSGITSLRSPGRDIVFIDRSSSQCIVMPRCQNKPLKSHAYASPTRIMHRFWTGPLSSPGKKREETAGAQDVQAWAMEGLDCRHWLASSLLPETVLAFDDVINEVSHYRRQRASRGNYGNLSGEKYEVLTTVLGGWVYAYADQEDRELYIYLDSKDYVTIADAEKSIQAVRGVVLHEIVV